MTVLKYLKRLNCVDLLVSGYLTVTMLFIIMFFPKVPSAGGHILFRVLLLGVIARLPLFDKFKEAPVFLFIRTAYPLFILAFFYSETDDLNNVFFQNLDYHFARFDSMLFGFQPSLAFYDHFPQKWFSEMTNLGYFSYYFIIAAYAIIIFKKNKQAFESTVFCISCSFLVYYLIFIILPVAGPQYFFEPPHNQIADSGIFRKLVKLVEYIGERPTAAFPSSHVGIVFIIVLLAWYDDLPSLWWLVPVFMLLSLSTVYIKAHYAVDVIGGIITAPLILAVSKYLYRRIKENKKFFKTGTTYAKG